METTEDILCPHCQAQMLLWRSPADSTWGEATHYVCFNDECSYYLRGWERMLEKFNVRASYRNRYNPRSGNYAPLPVWSADAHKDAIVAGSEME